MISISCCHHSKLRVVIELKDLYIHFVYAIVFEQIFTSIRNTQIFSFPCLNVVSEFELYSWSGFLCHWRILAQILGLLSLITGIPHAASLPSNPVAGVGAAFCEVVRRESSTLSPLSSTRRLRGAAIPTPWPKHFGTKGQVLGTAGGRLIKSHYTNAFFFFYQHILKMSLF